MMYVGYVCVCVYVSHPTVHPHSSVSSTPGPSHLGTALYRAPEQELSSISRRGEGGGGGGGGSSSSVSRKGYNEKADLFSLGVVLFEMGHPPFQTGMERLLTLRKLREKAELPAEFATGSSALRQIVLWLVHADPDKRPSAAQLLASPLLPPRADTDSSYLKEITRALWKPNSSSSSSSSASSEILSVLFDQPIAAAADTKSKPSSPADEQQSSSLSLTSVSFDIDVLENYSRLLLPRSILSSSEETSKQHHHQHHHQQHHHHHHVESVRGVCSLRYLAALKDIAKSTFRRHGAVEFRPKLLELRSSSSSGPGSTRRGSWNPLVDDNTSKQLQYMDCTGKIIHLETNLITQFAKVAAFAQVQRSQRFAIDGVYVPHGAAAAAGGHPLVLEEAAFDTVLLCPDTVGSGVGVGEGPGAATAAVAMQDDSLVFAEVEAVTAAIEFMMCGELQAFLPDCVLRLNDPRLLDSILELCGWQEAEAEAGESSSSTRGHHNHRSSSSSSSAKRNLSISSVEKESLLRLLSLAADGVLSPSEMSAAVADTTASWHSKPSLKPFVKRITPFLSVLCSCAPNHHHHHHHHRRMNPNPLHLLEALEQVLLAFAGMLELHSSD